MGCITHYPVDCRFVSKFSAEVYQRIHVSLILNNFIQVINTLQFYAAFQLLLGLEFMLSIGTGRKMIVSMAIPDQSGSDRASDMVVDSDVKDLYSGFQEFEPSSERAPTQE